MDDKKGHSTAMLLTVAVLSVGLGYSLAIMNTRIRIRVVEPDSKLPTMEADCSDKQWECEEAAKDYCQRVRSDASKKHHKVAEGPGGRLRFVCLL